MDLHTDARRCRTPCKPRTAPSLGHVPQQGQAPPYQTCLVGAVVADHSATACGGPLQVRVLVDEHLPVRFAQELHRRLAGPSVCVHAVRAGFGGFANGELQDSAIAANYDALVTSDMNMPFQTPPRLPVLVIAATNDIQVALAHVSGVVELLGVRSLAIRYHTIRAQDVALGANALKRLARIDADQLDPVAAHGGGR